MAIRMRRVSGVLVALCAVESDPRDGDTYLDDGVHYALATIIAADSYAFVASQPAALQVGDHLFDTEQVEALRRKFLDDWSSTGLIPGGHRPDVPEALSQVVRDAEQELIAWQRAQSRVDAAERGDGMTTESIDYEQRATVGDWMAVSERLGLGRPQLCSGKPFPLPDAPQERWDEYDRWDRDRHAEHVRFMAGHRGVAHLVDVTLAEVVDARISRIWQVPVLVAYENGPTEDVMRVDAPTERLAQIRAGGWPEVLAVGLDVRL